VTSSVRHNSRHAGDTFPPAATISFWIVVHTLTIACSESGLSAPVGTNLPWSPSVMLLGMQILVSGLIFPSLLRTWRGLALASAVAVPFLAISGRSAGTPVLLQLGEWGFLTAWLVALHPWAALAGRRNCRLNAAAAGALFTLGLPLLLYAMLDFRGTSPATNLLGLHPLLAINGFSFLHLPPPQIWAVLLGICVIGGVSAFYSRSAPRDS